MRVGEVVISTAGHDIGEWYIVEETLGEYVFLIDGKNKKLDNPKKKKRKHIISANFFAEEIAQKLTSRQNIQDAEVRKALKFFQKQN